VTRTTTLCSLIVLPADESVRTVCWALNRGLMSCCAVSGAKHTVMIAEYHRNVVLSVQAILTRLQRPMAAADCFGNNQPASADAIIAAYVEADFSTTERCYANVDTVAIGRACATAFQTGTADAVRMPSHI
jgi:hypothetical protein